MGMKEMIADKPGARKTIGLRPHLTNDYSHRYSNNEMMYGSLFVWNTGQLIQEALDARQAGASLSTPLNELPARYDGPGNGQQLYGWIYGQGAYNSNAVHNIYLKEVPALKALAPAIYDSAASDPQAPAPKLDTSNGTWGTFAMLVSAELLNMGSSIVASAQSLFGFDNSAMLAQMAASQQLIDTIGFDTTGGDGIDQLLAGSAKMVNDIFAGLTQINTNIAGYTFRILSGFKGILLGKAAEMPAPTPFLQYTDSGTSVAQQAGYVARVAIEGLVDGGVAFCKMGADLVQHKWNDARDHGFEALTMLVGAKLGETTPVWREIALKTKQVAFDVLEATYGAAKQTARAIWESEAVRGVRRAVGDAVETVRTVVLREKTVPSSDPALPPVKVTEVLTPERVMQENAGGLTEAPNGQVFETPRPDPACFTGDVLVYTNEGQTPILDIVPGAMVLSRSEITGEIGYRRVVQKFQHEPREVFSLGYKIENDDYGFNEDYEFVYDFVTTTPEHPFWVIGKGWVAAGKLQVGMELEICDPEGGTFYGDRAGGREGVLAQRLRGIRSKARVYKVGPIEERKYLVYNLEVEEFHTYFVGHMGAWVHNTKSIENYGPWVLEKVTPDAVPKGQRNPNTDPGSVGENRSITVMAQHGFEMAQMPDTTANIFSKKPVLDADGQIIGGTPQDTLVNGRTADAYTPQPANDVLYNIWGEISKKTGTQSSDIILNLDDVNLTPQQVIDHIQNTTVKGTYELDGLSRLYIIKGDTVTFVEYPATGKNAPVYGYVELRADGTIAGYQRYGYENPANKNSYDTSVTTGYKYNLTASAEGTAPNLAPLTLADINALLPAAKQYWLNAGALSSVLGSIQIDIGQLPTGIAAQAQYNKITLSADGAGWGWFVDPTPLDSIEFVNATSSQLIAPADSEASGKLDLLTVMIHEMGHALGLRHDAEGAMEAILQPGERNLPSDLEAALLQNIRNAVTAQASASAAPATPATQYQVVANAAFTGLDTPTGWNTLGSVGITNNAATLNEVSATHTRLSQVFTVNAKDRYLTFTLSGAALDDLTGAPPLPNPLPQAGEGANAAAMGSRSIPSDAFEAALLDASTGASLLGGIGLTRSDAFFNLQADGSQNLANCVTCTDNPDGSRTYLDLSGIAAGPLESNLATSNPYEWVAKE